MHDIWPEFLKLIREEVGSRVVETWFKAISLKRWDPQAQCVYLQVPNTFVQEWVQRHYVQLIRTHLSRLLNSQDLEISFVDAKEAFQKEQQPVIEVLPARVTRDEKNSLTPIVKHKHGQLNSRYTFDSFVVGPSNSLAYAAAHAITEKPGQLYNPLFIYGSSGLGKTHLLHAIGNNMRLKYRDARVLYQPADRFVNEFISAIRFDKVHKFKAKYHNVDLLLIDDVQFISKKEQTQEAFFHIFNALHDARKQIVFSSDTFPQDIDGIAERLRSRMAWGLVTDVYAPSLETKIAILKKKAAKNANPLSNEVAHFIASYVMSNIRELEGALIRVMAFASLTNQEVTLELAKRVLLRVTIVPSTTRMVDFERVLKYVCKHYPYTAQEVRSKNRSKELSLVRQITMFLMKKLTDRSLRDIGCFLGGRDHSTVMHALGKVEHKLKVHPDIQMKLTQIEKEIVS